MKILHIASFSSSRKNIGVVRQLQCEYDVVKFKGYDWDVELWSGDSVPDIQFIRNYPRNCGNRLQERWHFFKQLKKSSSLYDVLLLRYMPCDPFLPFFKSQKAKVIYVHHTKEVPSLGSLFPGLKGKIFALCEKALGFLSLRRADGLVAVTPEIMEYEKKRCGNQEMISFVVPNGIDYLKFNVCEDKRKGRIKIIFIASKFFSWHGLSDILNSLSSYRKKRNIELHLVGEVSQEDLSFIHKNSLEGVVFVHGTLSFDEIYNLLRHMDIGLASFSLGDSELTQACTLKVREYLAAGLPVYSGHVDSAFPDNFKYYKIGPVDFCEIHKFALQSRKISRNMVRELSQQYIDKAQLLSSFYKWIECNFFK